MQSNNFFEVILFVITWWVAFAGTFLFARWIGRRGAKYRVFGVISGLMHFWNFFGLIFFTIAIVIIDGSSIFIMIGWMMFYGVYMTIIICSLIFIPIYYIVIALIKVEESLKKYGDAILGLIIILYLIVIFIVFGIPNLLVFMGLVVI
ncbi:MAG: hypothetical protein ACTSPY_00750 [Candidatus Helarchaeota archaeon]